MKNYFLATLGLCLTACATSEPPSGLLGAYRLDDGRTVSIRRSVDSTLRYRVFEDGSTGRLYPIDDNAYVSGPGFAEQSPVELEVRFRNDGSDKVNALEWRRTNATALTATRIGDERELVFSSHGVDFYGQLQLPEGPPPYPAVVLMHGSGDSVATDFFYNGDFFVANGIAAFTYDKRGTGRSGGRFTFDFELLADDAAAAVQRISTIAEIDGNNIGLSGYSQGGWTAPLAATKSAAVKFVIVNYGLIESPAEEARLEMRQLLIDAGVGDADLEDADELIRAAVNIVASDFKSGWDEFAPLRQRHGDAAWMAYLKGTPVDKLVNWPKFLTKMIGPRLAPDGLPWYYDSVALLQASETPMAWLLGDEDRSAPNTQTIATLRGLIEEGKPLQLVLFTGADHGMLLFEEHDGVRTYTRYAPEYFQTEVNAARNFTSSAN